MKNNIAKGYPVFFYLLHLYSFVSPLPFHNFTSRIHGLGIISCFRTLISPTEKKYFSSLPIWWVPFSVFVFIASACKRLAMTAHLSGPIKCSDIFPSSRILAQCTYSVASMINSEELKVMGGIWTQALNLQLTVRPGSISPIIIIWGRSETWSIGAICKKSTAWELFAWLSFPLLMGKLTEYLCKSAFFGCIFEFVVNVRNVFTECLD